MKSNSISFLQETINLGEKTMAASSPEGITEAVLVLGNTGSGKSTLVNYLGGAKLYAKTNQLKQYYIETDSSLPGVTIVDGSASGTTIPSKFVDSQNGLTYFDCPGFDDTRSDQTKDLATESRQQDIANAFFIKKLFSMVQNVKFLMVASKHNLSDGAAKFIKALKYLATMFVKIEDFTKSAVLVITKSSSNNEDKLKDFLKSLDLNEDQKIKTLIDSFAQPSGKIAFFMSPEQEGPFDPSNREDILSKIKTTPYSISPEVRITVSFKSITTLLSWHNELGGHISKTFAEITPKVAHYYKTAISNKSSLPNLSSKLAYTQKALSDVNHDPLNVEASSKKILNDHGINDQGLLDNISQLLGYVKFIKEIEPNATFTIPAVNDFLGEITTISTTVESIITQERKVQEANALRAKQEADRQAAIAYQNMLIAQQEKQEAERQAAIVQQNWLAQQKALEELKKKQAEGHIKPLVFHGNNDGGGGNGGFFNKPGKAIKGTFKKFGFMQTESKYKNPFLNLDHKSQKDILDSTGLNYQEMLETTNELTEIYGDWNIDDVFETHVIGE